MRIEKETTRTHTVLMGKKCDICGKEIEIDCYTNMTSIHWDDVDDGRAKPRTGTYEVCGINCFNAMLPKIMEQWKTIKTIEFDWESIKNSIKENQLATERFKQSN